MDRTVRLPYFALTPPPWNGTGVDARIGSAIGARDGSSTLHRPTRSPRHAPETENPAWSGDGTRLAFLRTLRSGIDEAWVVEVASQAATRRLAIGRSLGNLAWNPADDSLILGERTGGEHALVTVSAAGSARLRRLITASGIGAIAVGPAGDRLAYVREEPTSRLVTIDPTDGRRTPVEGVSSTRWDGELAITPDGEQLVFVSSRSGSRELWLASSRGSRPRRLTNFRGPFVGEPTWSEDQLWVVFSSTSSGDADIWRVDARGGLPEQLTFASSHELAPALSHDGLELYFASDRNGRWQIWRRPVDEGDGPAEQITVAGGFRSAESADRRWLYFDRQRLPGLWRIPTAGGPAEQVTDLLPAAERCAWALTVNGLFWTREAADGRTELLHTELADGATRSLGQLPGVGQPPTLAAGRDGLELWTVETQMVESDLVLVEGIAGF